MKVISTQRQLLGKGAGTLGRLGGPIGLAVGIFSLFARAMGEATKPPPPSPSDQQRKVA